MRQKLTIRKIALGGLFLALAVLFPQVFHLIGGPAAGRIFLPMHIPVMLAGFFAGPTIGVITGIISPLLSFLITSMPMPPMLYFMVIELGGYGLAAGFLFRKLKLNIYVSLIISMIFGRLLYGAAILTAVHVLKINIPPSISVFGAVTAGIPGLIIQIIFIPAVVYLVERRMQLESN
ncbi:MAG TPA: ECF transporter S component [Clostridiaceae bacterium]|nr:ECF transporter S component [Clostridiaceae bacterium]